MENILNYLEQGIFWFGTLVASASLIVKATPTQKDDLFLAKVVKILDFISIFNAKIKESKDA